MTIESVHWIQGNSEGRVAPAVTYILSWSGFHHQEGNCGHNVRVDTRSGTASYKVHAGLAVGFRTYGKYTASVHFIQYNQLI